MLWGAGWLGFGMASAIWFLWKTHDPRRPNFPESVGWFVILTVLGPLWVVSAFILFLCVAWPRRFY